MKAEKKYTEEDLKNAFNAAREWLDSPGTYGPNQELKMYRVQKYINAEQYVKELKNIKA